MQSTAMNGLKAKIRLIATALIILWSVTGHAEPADIEVFMPGPWGDEYSDTLPAPEKVDSIESTQGFRQQQMQMLSAYYRSLEQVLRYEAEAYGELEDLATTFARRARQMPDWFRKETPASNAQPGALAVIWESERFEQHLEQFQDSAQRLAKQIRQSGKPLERKPLLEDLNRVRHQCLACHQDFRRR